MNAPASRSLHDLGFSEMGAALSASGVSTHHAKALWRAVQREGELDLGSRDFLPPLKRWVEDHVGAGKSFFLDAPEVVAETHSSDGLTRKFLLRQPDETCAQERAGLQIEGRLGLLLHQAAGGLLALVRRQMTEIVGGQPEVRIVEDGLHRLAVTLAEHRPQGGMAAQQKREGARQGGAVEVSRQTRRAEDVAGPAPGVELP